MKAHLIRAACIAAVGALSIGIAAAMQSPAVSGMPAAVGAASPARATLPAGYVVGAEDVLAVIFWREKDLSAEVVVRPDGKVSLPLLKDVQAAGYTPEELGVVLAKAASKYVTDPEVTVLVKEIKSRKVYVTGEVARPGSIALGGDMNVLQAIAVVGGLLEWADRANIVVVRQEQGRETRLKFNYNDVLKGKNTQQNVLLKPGDTILVR
jgi:polysaccharide biosynthesis/export protein